MGLFYFLGIVVLVVLVCAAALWIIGQLAPNHPPIIDRGVWVLAVVILVVILVQAMGLLSHDVPIPRVR